MTAKSILRSILNFRKQKACKWIEVNIFLSNTNQTDDAIRDVVNELVTHFKKSQLITSWHFFREPELRLRFYGKQENMKKVQEIINQTLLQRETINNTMYMRHALGNHGNPNQEYTGEAGYWHDDWNSVMKLWEHCAEFSLGQIAATSRPLDIHGERHVHLLLNQLGLPHYYVDNGNQKIIQYVRQKQPGE